MTRTTLLLSITAAILLALYWDKRANGSKGLGDSVGNFLQSIGIEKRPGCSCQNRHTKLNELVPYS